MFIVFFFFFSLQINSEIIHEEKRNSISTTTDSEDCDVERPKNAKLKNNCVKKLKNTLEKNCNEEQKQEKDFLKTSTKSSSSTTTTIAANAIEATTATETLPDGSCLSSSDTELPAAINAAIKCVESCSESDNNDEQNQLLIEPKQQYTSTLLRDFMVKTAQMLGSGDNSNNDAEVNDGRDNKSVGNDDGVGNEEVEKPTGQQQQQEQKQNQKQLLNRKASNLLNCNDVSSNKNLTENQKNSLIQHQQQQQQQSQSRKRRGRPKKNSSATISTADNIVNESADSGITSITQSLSPSPKNHHHHHNSSNSSNGNCNNGSGNNNNNSLTSTNIKSTITAKTTKEQNHSEQIIMKHHHHHHHHQQHQQQRGENSTFTKHFQHNKLSSITGSLDKMRYAVTERVLYPQRERKKPIAATSTSSSLLTTQRHQSTKLSSLSLTMNNTKQNNKGNSPTFSLLDNNRPSSSNHIDPLWKKIDVNMKFRRPSLTGYKSDGGSSTICSKILAARSGYVSDYGSVGPRSYSGYKSDVSGKSRSSMRSNISRAKSCSSVRSRRLGGRRRRPSISSSHHQMKSATAAGGNGTNGSGNVNLEQDILQLAGLSLGQSSEESSRESICKTSLPHDHSSKLFGEINRFVTTGEYFSRSKHHTIHFGGSVSSGTGINDLSSLRRQNDFLSGGGGIGGVFGSSLLFSKDFERFSKRIRSRRSSAVSRCSSSYSMSSKHDSNKRRRRRKMRFYSRLQSRNGCIDSKLLTEIDILVNSFPALCKISCDKNSIGASKENTREKSEKDKTNERGSKTQSKRNQKKKKQSDSTEHHHHQHHTSNTTLKRRHKKAAHASPDDHKLPLKKRHYLLTPGEKSSTADSKNPNSTDLKNKDGTSSTGEVASASGSGKSSGKSSNANGAGGGSGGGKTSNSGGSKATVVTPKKRHLLETSASGNEEKITTTTKSNQSTSATVALQSADVKPSTTTKSNESNGGNENITTSIGQQKSQSNHFHVKGDALTKKKNRLEGLLSKIQSANSSHSTAVSNLNSAVKDSAGTSIAASLSSTKSTLNNESNSMAATTPKTGSHPPPGVFEPTIELEIQIPLVKVATDGVITTKSEVESPKVGDPMNVDKVLPTSTEVGKVIVSADSTKSEQNKGVVEALLNKTAAANLMLKRKRRKPINRTGFPSLKKKKRKVIVEKDIPTSSQTESESGSNNVQDTTIKSVPAAATTVATDNTEPATTEKSDSNETQEKLCDRVPHDGETSDTFLERNSKPPRLSVVSLERLQDPQTQKKQDNTTSTEEGSVVTPSKTSTPVNAAATTIVSQTKPLKVNLRKTSPNHRTTPSIDVDSKKKEKSITRQRRTTILTKDKRTSTRSPKVITTNTAVTTATTNDSNVEVPIKSTKANNNSENKSNANSLGNKSKSKRLTTTANAAAENKNKNKSSSGAGKSKSGTKNKLSETIEEEAKLKPIKKSKKDAQQVKSTTKSTAESEDMKKKTKALLNKKSKESQSKNTINGAYQKTSATTVAGATTATPNTDSPRPSSSSSLLHIEDLEQEPLPPLEVNENIITDSADETVTTATSTVTTTVVDDSDSTVKVRKTMRWKKNYLVAGLFSNFYKSIRPRKNGGSERGNKNDKEKDKEKEKETSGISDTNNGENSQLTQQQCSLLPPPPYCEKFFRRTVQDFLLPYDIWWAYKNSKLPTKVMVPSWNYKKIRTNVYGDVRPNLIFDQQQCICKPESGCGDDCLNRMVYTECSPSNCPCGDKCKNQKIQKHEISPGIERFMTQNKGWGVKTLLPIRKGTYILEYVGEVVTEKEFKERMATMYANDTHHYCLHLDGGLVIDGHRMGSDGRFVNHSCSPNCEMQKWSVNGLSRMALFAARDIERGEELTYDYNFSLFNPSEGQLCRCETPQCRGVIGGKSQRVKPLEQKVNVIT